MYMLAAISLLSVAAALTALAAISVECYDKHESYKKDKKSNYDYTQYGLYFGVTMIVMAFASMYFAYKKDGPE